MKYRALQLLMARVPKGERIRGHSMRIANSLTSEVDKTVAYLHDMVEDGYMSEEEVSLFFGAEVMLAVRAITRNPGVTYNHYIQIVSWNPIATRVKLADLADNLRDLPAHKESLRTRYTNAQEFLREIAALDR